MTDTSALNGMGGYGYGYGYDPYFMQAYQAYNLNQAQAMQAAEAQRAAAQAAQTQAATQTATVPMTAQQPEEKKSNAGLVIGGLATVGAAALLYKAHKKGGDKGIKEGLKMMWKGVTGKGNQAPKREVFTKFTARQTESGTWFAQVPNRHQRVDLSDTAKLNELGIPTEIPKVGDKGVRVREFVINHDGNTLKIRNDKVVKYENKNNEDILNLWNNPVNKEQETYKETIEKIISKIKNGEATDAKLEYIKYSQVDDGIIRTFTKKGTDDAVMTDVITNRFGLGSKEVTAARVKDANVDKALTAIKHGKAPEGMVAKQAKYSTSRGSEFQIKDGELKGMYGSDGKLYKLDSTDFLAWQYNNQKAYDKMLKDIKKGSGLYNIIWQTA